MILVVVLGIIYFIIRWISANWSTTLLIIEIVGSIIIVAAVLYAIYYFRNCDEIQREKQRQREIDERAKEIRRERQLSERFSKYNKNESSGKNIKSDDFRYIPAEVKKEVWKRDDGRCVICGSRHLLEYDHEIPVCQGGSNTANNIRILYRHHNRKKSGKIE